MISKLEQNRLEIPLEAEHKSCRNIYVGSRGLSLYNATVTGNTETFYFHGADSLAIHKPLYNHHVSAELLNQYCIELIRIRVKPCISMITAELERVIDYEVSGQVLA